MSKALSPSVIPEAPATRLGADESVGVMLLQQTLPTVPGDAQTAADQIAGFKPRDQLEGMLAAQMSAIHNQAMRMLGMSGEYRMDLVERQMNLANKLLRTFVMQIEALNHYRGKGRQRVTVKHVRVEAGGQAIVGNVEGGTRGAKA